MKVNRIVHLIVKGLDDSRQLDSIDSNIGDNVNEMVANDKNSSADENGLISLGVKVDKKTADETPISKLEEEKESGEGNAGNEPSKRNPMSNAPVLNTTRVVLKFDDIDVLEDDDSDITVSVVTWNLAEESPSEEEASFIRKFRDSPEIGSKGSKSFRAGSDIVLISGQECENTKPRRSEGHRSREFRRLMIKMLGKKYVPLAIHSLGGVQFGLFCKRGILGDVESVSVADVACGIGNVFHNKGAIAAFVKMKARERKRNVLKLSESPKSPARSKSLRMLFISAHMAAHVKHVDARTMDYWRIASELEAQAPPSFLPPKPVSASVAEDPGEERGSGSYLMDSVDRVFFCGDLNYRVDLPREVAEHTVNELVGFNGLSSESPQGGFREEVKLREQMLQHDQLLLTLADGRAFPGFAEGKITFPPTFKFDKDTKEYDTSHKQRIPAWTDRVLFKPFGVRVLDYASVEDATHSDHRPVYGSFRVSMEGRELPEKKGSRRQSQCSRNRTGKIRVNMQKLKWYAVPEASNRIDYNIVDVQAEMIIPIFYVF